MLVLVGFFLVFLFLFSERFLEQPPPSQAVSLSYLELNEFPSVLWLGVTTAYVSVIYPKISQRQNDDMNVKSFPSSMLSASDDRKPLSPCELSITPREKKLVHDPLIPLLVPLLER